MTFALGAFFRVVPAPHRRMGDSRYAVFRLDGGLGSISAGQHLFRPHCVFPSSQIHYSADPVVYWEWGGVGWGGLTLEAVIALDSSLG